MCELIDNLPYVPLYANWIELMETKDTEMKQFAFMRGILDAYRGKEPPKPQDLENPHGTDYARRDGYLVAKPIVGKKHKGGQPGNKNAQKTNTKTNGKTNSDDSIKRNKNEFNKNKNKNKNKIKEEEVVVAAPPPTTTSVLDAQADADAAMMNRPTKSQVLSAAGLMGIKPDVVDRWLVHMRQWEWHFSDGGCVTLRNFRTSLQSFAARERREDNEASSDTPNIPPVTEAQRARMKRLNEVLNI